MTIKSIAYEFREHFSFYYLNNETSDSAFILGNSCSKFQLFTKGSLVTFEGKNSDQTEIINWLHSYTSTYKTTLPKLSENENVLNPIRFNNKFYNTSEQLSRVVFVVSSSAEAEIPSWSTKLSKLSEGVFIVSELRCDDFDDGIWMMVMMVILMMVLVMIVMMVVSIMKMIMMMIPSHLHTIMLINNSFNFIIRSCIIICQCNHYYTYK
jgi:hypothetical protein